VAATKAMSDWNGETGDVSRRACPGALGVFGVLVAYAGRQPLYPSLAIAPR
jgi:hypothetical protein